MKLELIDDTQVDKSGPAIDIRTHGEKTRATAGKIPLIHYGGWELESPHKISDRTAVTGVVSLARELIQRVGALEAFPAMCHVNIRLNSQTGNLVIKAADPQMSKDSQ